MALKPVTEYVKEDEPCYSYAERVLGENRYRIVSVLRRCAPYCCGDSGEDLHIADYVEDMGLANLTALDEFLIPGGVKELESGRIKRFYIEHTVAEMREMAEWTHECKWPDFEPTDLITGWVEMVDQRRRAKVAQSTFGKGGILIR